MSTPGIYKKLHSIMSEANYIQKDKKNPHFGYSYASEAAIKEKLHELLVKHGVLFNASGINHQVFEVGKTAKGGTVYRTTIDLAYRFFDIEDGSFVEGTMPGAGVDEQDKGTYKAITGALKYCLTTQFIIPTGDDPEGEDGAPRKEKKEKTNRGDGESRSFGPPPVTLREMLRAIDTAVLDETEARFIEETRDRVVKWGDNTKISDKQLNWLKGIYKKAAANGTTDDYTA